MGSAHDNRIFTRAVERFKQLLAKEEQQQRGSVNRQVDHPRLWGFIALIALGVAFSGKVNAIATWISIVLAWVMLGMWLIGFNALGRDRTRRCLSFGLTLPILATLAYFLAPTIRPRLIASLDYVAGGCVFPEPPKSFERPVSTRARTILLYIVTLKAEGGDIKIDESSIACSANSKIGDKDEEQFRGKPTTDLYGIALYAMGGAESINTSDWLAEAAFAGPMKAGAGTRKRVACEIPNAGNPMKVFFGQPNFQVSFKDTNRKLYTLTGKWAEPPMPLRRRSELRPGLDRRFIGLQMDNLPPRLTDVKPALLINFAARLSPDGKPVPDSIPWNLPTSETNYYGFELCSYH